MKTNQVLAFFCLSFCVVCQMTSFKSFHFNLLCFLQNLCDFCNLTLPLLPFLVPTAFTLEHSSTPETVRSPHEKNGEKKKIIKRDFFVFGIFLHAMSVSLSCEIWFLSPFSFCVYMQIFSLFLLRNLLQA
jgi:hypothetical protein